MLGRLKKELRVWMRLQHPNVAPLLGFNFDEEIAIISPWFSHGNISDYLTEHPGVDKLTLLQGIADGVLYLHTSAPVIVHGDLKPDNVLIDQRGVPRIIDFGLSKLLEEEPNLSPALSASLREAGNARWTAPELLLDEDASRSLKTDIFSFGCIAFFILSGDVPFKTTPDRQLIIARYKCAYPIPEAASYPELNSRRRLMSILHSCWSPDPRYRPFIGHIVQSLKIDDSNSPDLPLLTGLLGITARISTCLLEEQPTLINTRLEPWAAIMRLWNVFKVLLQRIFK
ncbi:hypothetical protein FRC01_003121 [Tulasnella sp. 417]|nr:hypothetical protein FRC01_003121 [Tulasnella sp. 417]